MGVAFCCKRNSWWELERLGTPLAQAVSDLPVCQWSVFCHLSCQSSMLHTKPLELMSIPSPLKTLSLKSETDGNSPCIKDNWLTFTNQLGSNYLESTFTVHC
ncbi:hypothetical protein J6590_107193 [Homalodisca vitripennis]|nr:hypothetical protein J6590_055970 [Homalodisca vitripennis]KAG8323792.1 hypothetical protein J6590_107193 [Homalodisca vitripennis]